ncbi:peptidoglycan/LPS O-acetylase OafA/YrhL [Haloactinopolyspora alba]|uniref:Peptidoglycan/LPS O-acetylase OafA/YrhL n=1 Tax=Haloactinopolyspora alba TaxID=648780 RepID=A0A2P8E0T0_9ACTN|nr:peptidoglycan/LPS O-acetylase OafA/YrhL [Haloactinopolyspora alba]
MSDGHTPAGADSAGYRGDIQGLRAVAVMLVLGFHAGVPFLTGGFVGVDVFFVISGFLITGLIDREIGRTGRLSLSRFWARRARRLLPATAVVLGSVGAVTIIVLPVTRWSSAAWDIGTSALYVVNWRLAEQSVNYLAANDAPSVVQHFWSLAVEEQFYVVWPVLILLVLWVQRRYRLPLTKVLLAGIAAIGVPSLLWSIYLSEVNAGRAYFVSTTRLWELAIGAALAIVAHRLIRIPAVTARVLGVLGLAAIGYAAVSFDSGTTFPGAAALVPTLGAAAVLAAGTAGHRTPAGALLDTGAMRDIGTLSYSLYLWHWPLLVGAAVLWGGDDGTLPVAIGVVVVGFSAVPAWLTYRLVEAPIHHAPAFARFPWRAGVLGVACTAVGVAAAVTVSTAIPKTPEVDGREAAGAAVLSDDPAEYEPPDSVDAMVPAVLDAPDDVADLDGETCISTIVGTDLESCTYGPRDAETTVAVAGDSKMHQWLPALERIADERGWRLVTYLKSACPLVGVDVEYEDAANHWCADYNDRRFDALTEDDTIDYVLTSQVASSAYGVDGDATEAMVDGLVESWEGLEDAGTEVVVMVDNPNPLLDVMECVATHEDDLGACGFSRARAETVGGARAQLPALEQAEGIDAVDVRDYICPGDTCPPVIGNTLVYRQGSHLTGTYVESLTPRVDAALTDVLRD